MALSLVTLVTLDGVDVDINPEQVTSLRVVPTDLLPTGIADGTYVDLVGSEPGRLAVQGDLAATETALGAGGVGAGALKFSGTFEGAAGLVNVQLSDGLGEDSTQAAAPTDGYPWSGPALATLRDLRVNSVLNTLAAGDTTVELYVNNVASGVKVAVPAGVTGLFEDVTHEVEIAAGDFLSCRASNTAGTATKFWAGQVMVGYAQKQV